MKNKRNRRIRSGFSMVELMAVIIILGLLATVVVSNVQKHVMKGRKREVGSKLLLRLFTHPPDGNLAKLCEEL